MLRIHAPIIQKKKLIAFLIARPTSFSSCSPRALGIEIFGTIFSDYHMLLWEMRLMDKRCPSLLPERPSRALSLCIAWRWPWLVQDPLRSSLPPLLRLSRSHSPAFSLISRAVLVRAKRVFSINIAIKLLRRPFMVHCVATCSSSVQFPRHETHRGERTNEIAQS